MSSAPRQLTGLTDAFGKDLDHERLLARLNEAAASAEVALEAGREGPSLPVVFVMGPPRSGTTLVSQLLSSTRSFGTVTNVAARFWTAPALGVLVSRALGEGGAEFASSFSSKRGVTSGWGEPSEFGYFWSRFFDLGQSTHRLADAELARFDAAGLRKAVAAMEAAAEKPMAFKNNTWFTFHAGLLDRTFARSVFVVCRRDPYFLAQSIWMQRIDLYGEPARWWSVRPPDYDRISRLNPVQQVANQVVSIYREMHASLATVSRGRIIDAEYGRLTSAPRDVVAETLAAAGLDEQAIATAVSELPESFNSTDTTRIPPEIAEELRREIDALTSVDKR
ncbi:MAG: sulfotransferase [Gammaproteobacteria bacterium]|nr:sulfotransferase [Gammaproteobacteria bacterium]